MASASPSTTSMLPERTETVEVPASSRPVTQAPETKETPFVIKLAGSIPS